MSLFCRKSRQPDPFEILLSQGEQKPKSQFRALKGIRGSVRQGIDGERGKLQYHSPFRGGYGFKETWRFRHAKSPTTDSHTAGWIKESRKRALDMKEGHIFENRLVKQRRQLNKLMKKKQEPDYSIEPFKVVPYEDLEAQRFEKLEDIITSEPEVLRSSNNQQVLEYDCKSQPEFMLPADILNHENPKIYHIKLNDKGLSLDIEPLYDNYDFRDGVLDVVVSAATAFESNPVVVAIKQEELPGDEPIATVYPTPLNEREGTRHYKAVNTSLSPGDEDQGALITPVLIEADASPVGMELSTVSSRNLIGKKLTNHVEAKQDRDHCFKSQVNKPVNDAFVRLSDFDFALSAPYKPTERRIFALCRRSNFKSRLKFTRNLKDHKNVIFTKNKHTLRTSYDRLRQRELAYKKKLESPNKDSINKYNNFLESLDLKIKELDAQIVKILNDSAKLNEESKRKIELIHINLANDLKDRAVKYENKRYERKMNLNNLRSDNFKDCDMLSIKSEIDPELRELNAIKVQYNEDLDKLTVEYNELRTKLELETEKLNQILKRKSETECSLISLTERRTALESEIFYYENVARKNLEVLETMGQANQSAEVLEIDNKISKVKRLISFLDKNIATLKQEEESLRKLQDENTKIDHGNKFVPTSEFNEFSMDPKASRKIDPFDTSGPNDVIDPLMKSASQLATEYPNIVSSGYSYNSRTDIPVKNLEKNELDPCLPSHFSNLESNKSEDIWFTSLGSQSSLDVPRRGHKILPDKTVAPTTESPHVYSSAKNLNGSDAPFITLFKTPSVNTTTSQLPGGPFYNTKNIAIQDIYNTCNNSYDCESLEDILSVNYEVSKEVLPRLFCVSSEPSN